MPSAQMGGAGTPNIMGPTPWSAPQHPGVGPMMFDRVESRPPPSGPLDRYGRRLNAPTLIPPPAVGPASYRLVLPYFSWGTKWRNRLVGGRLCQFATRTMLIKGSERSEMKYVLEPLTTKAAGKAAARKVAFQVRCWADGNDRHVLWVHGSMIDIPCGCMAA